MGFGGSWPVQARSLRSARGGGARRRARTVRPPGGGIGRLLSAAPAFLLLQAQVPARVPSRIQGLPGDSVSLRKPPLPGGVADMVRQVFDAPQVVQIVAFFMALLLLATLVVIAWWQRAELLAWFTSRSRRTTLFAGLAGAVVVAGFGWFSLRSWNYMQHDNDFCSGCHVMAPAWQKFQTTRHAKLSCHQCHQQSIFASARQLVLWVADRPGQIPAHSKVPNARCIACHVKGDSTRWKQVAATEGHRLHLESPKLAGLQCVRCHGFSVHQFVPTDMTCGQAGCHTDVRIRLGKMTNVTALHCAVCHKFTRTAASPTSVPDSLRRWLTPTRQECFTCHAMQRLLTDQQLAHDPHGAVCGACHNPHTQTTASEAVRSCVNCHTDLETLTPFHRGLPAGALASCTSCHQPHSWKTHGAGQCTSCHGNILNEGTRGPAAHVSTMPWGRLYARLKARLDAKPLSLASPGVPALRPRATARRQFAAGAVRLLAGRSEAGRATPFRFAVAREAPGRAFMAGQPAFRLAAARQQPAQQPQQQPQRPGAAEPRSGRAPGAPQATPPGQVSSGPFRGFSHPIHRSVACTSCHSMRSAHGALLIRSAEDCMRCHHSSSLGVSCGRCHESNTLPQGLTREVSVRTSTAPAPNTRTLPFSHSVHGGVACTSCHTGPPTYATIRTCTECHASHHTSQRECRVCHLPSPRTEHNVDAHLSCGGAGCHADAPVNQLVWSREVCLACHQEMANHVPGRSCADCHRVPALKPRMPARVGR